MKSATSNGDWRKGKHWPEDAKASFISAQGNALRTWHQRTSRALKARFILILGGPVRQRSNDYGADSPLDQSLIIRQGVCRTNWA